MKAKIYLIIKLFGGIYEHIEFRSFSQDKRDERMKELAVELIGEKEDESDLMFWMRYDSYMDETDKTTYHEDCIEITLL